MGKIVDKFVASELDKCPGDRRICAGCSLWAYERQKPSHNTGSPKLPSYGEFEAWCRNASIHISVCKPIYEWIGRQLRADV